MITLLLTYQINPILWTRSFLNSVFLLCLWTAELTKDGFTTMVCTLTVSTIHIIASNKVILNVLLSSYVSQKQRPRFKIGIISKQYTFCVIKEYMKQIGNNCMVDDTLEAFPNICIHDLCLRMSHPLVNSVLFNIRSLNSDLSLF